MYGKALNRIYSNLQNGETYGHIAYYRQDYPEKDLAGKEYFSFNLGKHYCKPLFCWTHYGSSANKATKKDLLWIITQIFGLTPEQFEQSYITRTAFIEKYGREM